MTRPITKGDWVSPVYKLGEGTVKEIFLVENVVLNKGEPLLHLRSFRGNFCVAVPLGWVTVKTFEERIAERLMK
jgi:hypothetical protein